MVDEPQPRYHVVDRLTGMSVGSYLNKNRARNEVDKRDNEHGSYKHAIEERYPDGKRKRVL